MNSYIFFSSASGINYSQTKSKKAFFFLERKVVLTLLSRINSATFRCFMCNHINSVWVERFFFQIKQWYKMRSSWEGGVTVWTWTKVMGIRVYDYGFCGWRKIWNGTGIWNWKLFFNPLLHVHWLSNTHTTCGSVVFISSLKQILPPYFLVSAVIVDGGVGFLPKVTAVLDQEHPCGSTLPKRW